MFGDVTATDFSPWDDFDVKVTYYGCLLSVTVLLILANAIFLTIVLSDGSPWNKESSWPTRCRGSRHFY